MGTTDGAPKSNTDGDGRHGQTVEHDPSKDDRSVFLSNLPFKFEEDGIKDVLKEVDNYVI